jgi:hypothetical protein
MSTRDDPESKARARTRERLPNVSSRLMIKLAPDGGLQDVQLDGESLWPIWFKIEWKGNGDLSAKIAGNRLSTRQGDEIQFVVEAPSSGGSPG